MNKLINTCKKGDLNTVKVLFKKISLFDPIDERAIKDAACKGHLPIVKYLFENKAPISEWAIAEAAEYGYIDIVKYLVENKAPKSTKAIRMAARNKHFDVVKYLVNKLKL